MLSINNNIGWQGLHNSKLSNGNVGEEDKQYADGTTLEKNS